MKINLTTSSTLGVVESCVEEESRGFVNTQTRRIRYRNEAEEEEVAKVNSAKNEKTIRPQSASFVIYKILHVWILLVIRWCLTAQIALRQVYDYVYSRFNDRVNVDRVDRTALAVPQHVSVILNDECLTWRSVLHGDDVVRKFSLVVDHLAKLGTRTVTFYQPTDARSSWLKEALLEKYSTGDLNNNNNNSNDNFKSDQCSTNGRRTTDLKAINVSFVTSELAGKCLLVNACKRLAFKVKSKTLNPDDINQQLVDTQINGNFILIIYNWNEKKLSLLEYKKFDS